MDEQVSGLIMINDFSPLVAVQKFTKPPPLYNGVSLCKTLDELEILRPSMANGTITKILVQREYVTEEKGNLKSTELGERVLDFLVKVDFCFIDPKFTAALESELDNIAAGKKDKLSVLQEFWKRLESDLENAKSVKNTQQTTDFPCPLCNGKLMLKHSKFGSFFSCENYKKPKTVKGKPVKQEGSCEYKADVGEDGTPKEKQKKETKVYEYASFKCSKCSKDVVKRTSKYGKQFWACSGYPSCTTIFNDDGSVVEQNNSPKKKWKKWKKK